MLKSATMKKSITMTAISLALLGSTAIVNADNGIRYRGQRDADLDVSGRVHFQRGNAVLNARIKAEIEGRFLRDAYNVVLTIEPANARFGRRFVRPQTIIVPLGRPSDIDDDEIEFKQRVSVVLPRNLARFGNGLIIKAKLVSASSGRVLDRDKSSVRENRQPIPRRPRHRGPRFGRPVIW